MSQKNPTPIAKQPRVFCHDATTLSAGAAATGLDNATLFIGTAGNVNVTLESGNTVTFKNINSGTFLPVIVTAVGNSAAGTTATDILIIY